MVVPQSAGVNAWAREKARDGMSSPVRAEREMCNDEASGQVVECRTSVYHRLVSLPAD